jgi:tRNA(Ile)-lysidine synthetase-like protein
MAALAIRTGVSGVSGSAGLRLPARSTPALRKIVGSWRRLTGGGRGRDAQRRTLVAVSGGADSSGLLLALAAGVGRAGELLVVGHVVHDLRTASEAAGDRDAAAALAERLGLPFVSAAVRVRAEGGNSEGAARRLRYAALAELAGQNGCGFVATGHHAGDQLESVLMGLVRGAGPAGLAGIAPKRRGPGGVWVIRPALGDSREELRELCRGAGVEWREDATNGDTSRLRAAIRRDVIPVIERIRPRAAAAAARSARLMRDAERVIEGRARTVVSGAARDSAEAGPGTARLTFERAGLRRERSVVVGAVIRLAVVELVGPGGRDRLGAKVLEPVVRAVRSKGMDPKVFPLRGVEVHVLARRVFVRCKDA